MKFIRLLTIMLLASAVLMSCGGQFTRPTNIQATAAATGSAVRVTVTRQGYIFHRPWQLRRPATQTGIGTVVAGGQVLVSAALVANHRYIELETLDTRRKFPAQVVVADYEANLALVQPKQDGTLAGMSPLALADTVNTGDRLSVWQVKRNGEVVPAIGQVTSIELIPYTHNNSFLAYRLNTSLQYRNGNITLPVVKGHRLAGLVLRTNTNSQTIEVASAEVIAHFLKEAGQPVYGGFPTAGFRYNQVLDHQLRQYLGLPTHNRGIYVQSVTRGGPADRAGLKAGDVITHIGGQAVSNSGTYDHPRYGRISVAHLIRSNYFVGDRIGMTVWRSGRRQQLSIVLDHRRPEDYLVPPYVLDRQPAYRIVGGLIFQELSLSYLREYGKDWARQAPVHLLYYNQNQDYLDGNGREKIVILSGVIPTAATVGYEELGDLVLTKVNGQSIGRLADVNAALGAPVNGFHRFEFEQHPSIIYLDAASLPTIHDLIRKRYRIPIASSTPVTGTP